MVHAAAHGGGQPVLVGGVPGVVEVREYQVGALTAELERDALDRVGRRLAHRDAAARRAGERDHVDARVAAERGADGRAVAVDEIEGAWREAGLVDELGEEEARERRHLRRLEHHRVPRQQSGHHLERALVHRPVPRRDQPADADGLVTDEVAGRARRIDGLLESKPRHHAQKRPNVSETRRHLRRLRQRDGCAHLDADRLRHLAGALLVEPLQVLTKTNAIGHAAPTPLVKRGARRPHRSLHVRLRAKRERCHLLASRGVLDRQDGMIWRGQRLHPLATDVEVARRATTHRDLCADPSQTGVRAEPSHYKVRPVFHSQFHRIS